MFWYRFFRKNEKIDLNKFRNDKDAAILREIIRETEGRDIDSWVNSGDCKSKDRIYLTGPELRRYIQEHGYTDLCVGSRGGVYIPANKFKGVSSHDDIGGKTDNHTKEVKNKRGEVLTLNGANGVVSIKISSKLRGYVERILNSERPDGRLSTFIASIINLNIYKILDNEDIVNINPDENLKIKNFDVVVDSFNVLGLISFFEMEENELEAAIEYLKMYKEFGNPSDKQKEELAKKYDVAVVDLEKYVSNIMFSGLSVENLDGLRELYNRFWSGSKEEKERIFADLMQDVNVIASLYSISDWLSKNYMLRKCNKSPKDNVICVSDIEKIEETIGVERFKKVVLLASMLDAFTNIGRDNALAISKGIILWSLRMNGTYSTNAYYIDEFLKEFVFGNGRPSRVPNMMAHPNLSGYKYIYGIFGNPKKEFLTYKSFVEQYFETLFGESTEVYRSLNIGESLLLGSGVVVEEFSKLIGDEKKRQIFKDLFSDFTISKVVGYTLSTSFSANTVQKFAKFRKWIGGPIIRMKITKDDVLGLPLSAKSGYLDDTEITVLIPKEGKSFEIVDVVENRNNPVIKNILYASLQDAVDYINGNGWENVMEDYMNTMYSSYRMLLSISGGIEKDNEEYRKYWKSIVTSFVLGLEKMRMASKMAGVSRDKFEDYVLKYFDEQRLKNLIMLSKLKEPNHRSTHGRERNVRHPYLAKFPDDFEEFIREYNTKLGGIGFGGKYLEELANRIKKVW